MQTILTDRHREPDRAELEQFLAACQEEAVDDGRGKLVSIVRAVEPLDPLAVLQSIYEVDEWHAFIEQPEADWAVAGAEAVVLQRASGPDRLTQLKRWGEALYADTIRVGDTETPFAGPLVFCGVPFFAEDARAADFPEAVAFVPRWQVARAGIQGTAVANIWVTPEADIQALSDRVWAAYERFSGFDYSRATPAAAPLLKATEEVAPEAPYASRVAAALDEIGGGAVEKIVVSRALDLTFAEDLRPLETVHRLRERFPRCFAFSLENETGTSFIGASPERLVKLHGGRLFTEALAGTEPRGQTLAEDARLARQLLASEKDRREHAFVVRSIERRLQPLGITIEAGEPALLRLANVQHLRTPLAATVTNGTHVLDLAAALHPTSAVGGTPREAALARLPGLEPFPREIFAGLVGWFDHAGEGEFAVALRSARVRGATARLFAGAGIVAGSQPTKEHAETDAKLQALRAAIAPEKA